SIPRRAVIQNPAQADYSDAPPPRLHPLPSEGRPSFDSPHSRRGRPSRAAPELFSGRHRLHRRESPREVIFLVPPFSCPSGEAALPASAEPLLPPVCMTSRPPRRRVAWPSPIRAHIFRCPSEP